MHRFFLCSILFACVVREFLLVVLMCTLLIPFGLKSKSLFFTTEKLRSAFESAAWMEKKTYKEGPAYRIM